MIGIQLYTVREALNDDFRGTLKRLADLGFAGVEFAWNYGGLEPAALRELLDELGLTCLGVYAPAAQSLDPASDAYRYARGLDSPYLTTGLNNAVTEADWPGAIETIRSAADIAAGQGLQLLYHNHAEELRQLAAGVALDLLLAATDPGQVLCELDIAWIYKGGADPVTYINRYAARLPLLHVKDMTAEGRTTELGRGAVDLPAAIAAGRAAGVAHFVYEQDVSDLGCLESAAQSIARLRALLEA